jgi:hypothetical protein
VNSERGRPAAGGILSWHETPKAFLTTDFTDAHGWEGNPKSKIIRRLPNPKSKIQNPKSVEPRINADVRGLMFGVPRLRGLRMDAACAVAGWQLF